MFRVCDATVLGKTDLLPHLSYEIALTRESLRSVKAGMRVFELSARSGAGMQPWLDWLAAEAAAKMARRSQAR